jgi:16S rRNA G966 N2-methylase RsmD
MVKTEIGQNIEEIFGRDLLILTEQEQDRYICDAFYYWRGNGFPYPKLTTEEIKRDFERIKFTKSGTILKNGLILSSTVGLGLANSFMPQMWRIACQGHKKTPIEHFNDDETLVKLLRRAISFWPDRQCWRAYNVRNILRIYSGGRVSNFRPTAAKAIIETFSKNDDHILDFCAGFGGRLLGAMALKRHYVGVDASKDQITGLYELQNHIKNYSEGTSEFFCESAEDFLPQLESNSFDMVFTSPPYFNLEKYCIDRSQSYLRYENYEEWKNKFMYQLIIQSGRLLKTKGFLVLNVANIKNYPVSNDVGQFCNSRFHLIGIYHLAMNSRPVQRSNGISYKYEPIFVFQKK